MPGWVNRNPLASRRTQRRATQSDFKASHAPGVPPEIAAERILNLAARMIREKRSGPELKKEELTGPEWLGKLS
jgi:hypothetical protein